ncbi:MAG: IS110 family transposase [Methanotrichaceae archaeon]|nr:IS110 family transposase [Methanotrichaceae archaeon]
MLYLGLDVHSKWMVIKGFDPDTAEEVEIERQPNDEESLAKTFESLPGPLYGAMESGTNSWAVYRMLEPYFEKLVVVDPATVWGRELRRGAKTDRKDARALAIKLYRGELDPLYVPDVSTQDCRSLGRAKINASRHVTKTVNEIGSLLRSWGIVLSCSLLSEKGQGLIEEARQKLPKHSLMVLEMWLEMLRVAREAEDKLQKAIELQASEDEACQRLTTIPGVGALTALVVRAEIGDISRFGSAEQLVRYCGLCPDVSQSGESTRYGRLVKGCNRYLRYVLVLRAQWMARAKIDNPMRQTYWRIVFKGRNHAKIAVSRQLTRVIYRMLRDGQDWDGSKIAKRRALGAAART